MSMICTTAPLWTALVLLCYVVTCSSFTVVPEFQISGSQKTTSLLWSTPQPQRQPRRNLKKRRRSKKRRGDMQPAVSSTEQQFPWDTVEVRPLVSSKSREVGTDYWIDEEDLRKSIERKQAIRNRKAMEGEIPKEKLWSEVFAPYKQNWIGMFSMMILILTVIVTKFPELLNQPVIPIPDL